MNVAPHPLNLLALPATPRPRIQRAFGRARIVLRRRGEATVVERMYQEGAAKFRLPRPVAAEVAEAILINTAGGWAGGDNFGCRIELRPKARAVMTTQACERVYRSHGEPARVTTGIALEAGSRLDYLPQETIFFDGGRLTRRLDVDLARGAEFLAVESVLWGRQAMGETVRSGSFHERWRIRREGRLLHAEDQRLEGDLCSMLRQPAALAGRLAMATVFLAVAEPEAYLEPVRNIIGDAGGASAWNGKLVARIAAADGFALRQLVIPVLILLSDGRPLPKAWQL